MSAPSPELDLDGPAAPPRDNGELVFTAPWQPRVFGVTMALVDAGALDWTTFRTGLVAAVAAAPGSAGEPFDYWSCWAGALEQVLADRGVLGPADVDGRVDHLARRPAGHDHDHDHGHGAHDHRH